MDLFRAYLLLLNKSFVMRLLPLMSVLLFISCASEDKNQNVLDLMKYGIPFSIQAPEGAEVKSSDFGSVMKDVTIQKGKDYFIQIFAADASITDLAKIKTDQLQEVKEDPYFSRIVKDYPHGFIYESKIDSSLTNYGFRYIKLQGDKEYILRNGLIGSFTEVQINGMYESVSGIVVK